LDNDVPVVSFPRELNPTLVNVHEPDDQVCLSVKEKRRRAREKHDTNLGLREALLCRVKSSEIHPEWYFYWVYFGKTIIEVDDLLCVVCIDPDANGGCISYYGIFDGESNDSGRFARLSQS
jgi:hypothetical protein